MREKLYMIKLKSKMADADVVDIAPRFPSWMMPLYQLKVSGVAIGLIQCEKSGLEAGPFTGKPNRDRIDICRLLALDDPKTESSVLVDRGIYIRNIKPYMVDPHDIP